MAVLIYMEGMLGVYGKVAVPSHCKGSFSRENTSSESAARNRSSAQLRALIVRKGFFACRNSGRTARAYESFFKKDSQYIGRSSSINKE